MTLVNRQNGFSLLEVMVSVVVFSLGLAGLAALQVANLKSTQQSNLRSMAALQADNLREQMKSNLAAYTNGTYSTISAASHGCSTGTECGSEALAEDGFNDWLQQLSSYLPNGIGILCVDGTPNDGQPGATECDGAGWSVVKVWWDEDGDGTFELFATEVYP